ncbi:hypothetical protein [Pleurocapsa sp. FMAR1]|uniref:hypothetical protein n=1 Tax=Pleurocapsa sp. FMAR1 TaxID=3040204 RepID=UPI0029C676BB|nr:hypothetical protein [Pleurocapsa sp. FMAR1]
MNYPIKSCIKSFVPDSQYSLVSHKSFSFIDSITNILPAFTTAILECRLQDNQPRVDLEVNLSSKSYINLSEELLKYPEWQFCNNIYHDWVKNNDLLAEKVKHIWLEFDIEENSSLIPLPCIFLGLNRNKFNHKILIEISFRLLNRQLSFAFKSNLKHCVNCLPSKTCVFYLGAMLSRSEQTIRFVSLIPSDQISDYLKRIGWSGSQEKIKSLLSKLSEFTDYMCLSYDVGEIVMSRIGLECYLPEQPKYESRWKLFLDYLVKLNLCSEFKRNTLLEWSGYSKKVSKSASLFQDNNKLKWENIFLEQREPVAFIRKISHVKIVCNSDGTLEAKAYLHLCHEPINLKLDR